MAFSHVQKDTPEPWQMPVAFRGVSNDTLSPAFISSIVDENGLQRTVSGAPLLIVKAQFTHTFTMKIS